jgi:tetratricopeptide (TPR) repeat protein
MTPDPGTEHKPRLKVFLSYSHKDRALLEQLLTHLSQMQREGVALVRHDGDIKAGGDWKTEIDADLNTADIILLLVSPDFLASEYCALETRRAMERLQAGEAQVVPVILRHTQDWERTEFGRLQALPSGAKPVVEHRWRDRAFGDVVKGVRKTVVELRPDLAVPPLQAFVWQLGQSGALKLASTAALAMIVMFSTWAYRTGSLYNAQGEKLLSVGRYADAEKEFQHAQRVNPLSSETSLGLKTVELSKLRSDPVRFQQTLQQLSKEAPNDPHLKVFEGDYQLSLGHQDTALQSYQAAAKLNPNLAEAYFRMGVLYDKKGDSRQALEMHKTATGISPSSPQYAANLADQYFKRGEYREALATYGQIGNFPLAALESGKIHRLLGELTEARQKELIALEWLGQKQVASSAENQLPWYFEVSETEGVRLTSDAEKSCYARLETSVTLFLQGDEAPAAVQARQAAAACGPHYPDVQAIVRWEMQRVAGERPELAVRARRWVETAGSH